MDVFPCRGNIVMLKAVKAYGIILRLQIFAVNLSCAPATMRRKFITGGMDMADRRELGTEFWFDFDNQTLWRRTAEINAAIRSAYGQLGGSLDSPATLFAMSFRQPNHPVPFTTAL